MLAHVKGRHPPSDFQNLVSDNAAGTLNDFWRQISYQNVDVATSKVFGWYTALRT